MLKKIFKIFLSLLFIIFLVNIHLLFINYFSFPFSNYNLIISILAIILMYSSGGKVVWYAFFTFFLLDLFSAFNFGIIFFSGTIATLFIYWFFKDLFSKQNIWSLILMVILYVLVYNLIFLFVFYVLNNLFFLLEIKYINFFIRVFWEILITSFITPLIYIFTDIFLKKINKKYLIA
jgi:hypothetical protein